MAKKPKSIQEIRDEFRRSMQKTADKSGTSVSFSIIQDGKEKKLAEFVPRKNKK